MTNQEALVLLEEELTQLVAHRTRLEKDQWSMACARDHQTNLIAQQDEKIKRWKEIIEAIKKAPLMYEELLKEKED